MDIDVIEQKPVTMAEVGEMLEDLKKNTKELGFRAEKVNNYINENSLVKKKDAENIYKNLEGLGISRLRDRHLIKLIDVMPEDVDSLKAVFAGEATSLKQEEFKDRKSVV